MSSDSQPLQVGVVGFGYWGPKLLRNLNNAPSTTACAICDVDPACRERARRVADKIPVVDSLEALLEVPGLQAVAIATPVETHHHLVRQALSANKHVFVEKPFTRHIDHAVELIQLARERSRVIMVDHTFLYTAAVRKLHEIVDSGELGELLYYDSIRINLGLFQPDVDVIWDLAPHDFSILDYVVPDRPRAVSAIGAAHSPSGHCDVAYVTLRYSESFLAHVHLNWMSPVKVRSVLIGGSRRMVQYNDVLPDEKIRIYDKGIDVKERHTVTPDHPDGQYQTMISYRTGDMRAPWLDRTEALYGECDRFGSAVLSGATFPNDALSGLRVVLMLEAATQSMAEDGRFVEIDWTPVDRFESGCAD